MTKLDITWVLGYPCVIVDAQVVRYPRYERVKVDG